MSSSSQHNAILCFVKLTEKAQTPTRGSPRTAGLDLYSAYDKTVPAGGKVLISKDFANKTSRRVLWPDRSPFRTGAKASYRHRRGNS